jgi:4-amino-4-deoxy-L-arabinose transferase-like glycosyltransferase
LLGGFAIFHLLTLLRAPIPFVDEGWNASRAWGLLHTGQAFGTLDAGVFDKYPTYWAYFPWLGAALQALGLALFGPNLFAIRVVSLVAGVGLLFAIYIIARRLYGRRVGLLALVLVASSNAFMISSHLGRNDILVAAFGFAAVALYVTDSGHRFSVRSLLCGLAVGLTLDIHFNGIIYGPAVLVLYLLDYGWRAVRVPRFWGFVAGGLGGVLFFLVMHILPNPQTYFTLFALGNGTSRTPPVLVPEWQVWWSALVDTLTPLDMRVPLILVAVGVLIRRRSAADKKVLALGGVLLLLFLTVIRTKGLFYAILLSPAADLVLAGGLGILLQGWRRPSRLAAVRIALVVGLLLAGLIRVFSPLANNAMVSYQAALDGIRAAVPAGRSVIGSQNYWFALTDQPYYSWEQLIYYRRYAPGSTLAEALRALHPDYFIFDRQVDLFISDQPERLPVFFQQRYLPKTELTTFLAQHGRLVLTMPTEQFGNIEVYHLNWN